MTTVPQAPGGPVPGPEPAAPAPPDPSSGIVELYTDGACSGNPGPGGWAVLMRDGDTEREFGDGEPDTTNNRMELLAAVRGLELLERRRRVRLVTDSAYVRDGMASYIERWKRRGWRTSEGKPVKNRDLWLRLDEAAARHEVQWEWIRAHSGHPENERADARARAEAQIAAGHGPVPWHLKL